MEVTQAFRGVVEKMGVEVRTGTAYEGRRGKNEIITNRGTIPFKKLINAAGLYADKVARDFGFAQNYVIIPFKGIYLKGQRQFCRSYRQRLPRP